MRRILIYAIAGVALRLYGRMVKGDERAIGYFLFVLWNLIALFGLLVDPPIGTLMVAGGLVLAYPWLIARTLLIPLGLWRPAMWLGRAATITWAGGGAAIAGALALAHRRRPPPAGIARVDAAIRRGKLGCAKIVAAGLLAECRGDRATAVALMRSLELIDDTRTERCHRLARDFLIADAAETGDWHQVNRLASMPGPSSRLARFVGLAAARLEGDAAVADGQLRFAWLTARRRRRSWPLLRRALDHTPDADNRHRRHAGVEPAAIAVADTGDPIAAALDAHVQLARRAPEVEIDDLLALGALWDAAIDSGALRERADRRAADLQAAGADRAADSFAAEIETEIARLVRQSGVCMELIPGDSAIVCRAVAAVRRELLADIELAFSALEVRFESDRRLDAIDEWREMLALRELHAEAARVGGLPLRRIAFPQVHTPTCNYAVWLWNQRAEYLVADTIFRWLLAEATVVGDAEAIELQKRNID